MATAEAGDLSANKGRMAAAADVIGHHCFRRQAELQPEGRHQLGDGRGGQGADLGDQGLHGPIAKFSDVKSWYDRLWQWAGYPGF